MCGFISRGGSQADESFINCGHRSNCWKTFKLWTHYAAEAEMASGGVDSLSHAGGRPVASAVARGAEERAPLYNAPRHVAVLAGEIDAGLLAGTAGVGGGAAGRFFGVSKESGMGLVPVIGPFPYVADDVEQAVAVWVEDANGGAALVAIQERVVVRKVTLEGVGHGLAARMQLMAPGELRPFQAAPGRPLPLGLARQALTDPGRVGARISMGDMNYRVQFPAFDRTAMALRLAPMGPWQVLPPAVVIIEAQGARWRHKNHRGRRQ